MRRYGICHKDDLLLVFLFSTEVEACFLDVGMTSLLPLPLKHLVHHLNAFVSERNEDYVQLNEEACLLVQQWLENREIPLNRDGVVAIKADTDLTALMLENNACSLTDTYWVRNLDEQVTWDQVKYFDSDRIDTYHVIINDKGRMYSGANSTLGGQLEKFWYRSVDANSNRVKLCKRVPKLDEILAVREIWATKIYEILGFSAVHYDLVYDSNSDIVGCKCDAFTSEELELVTAADLLKEYNLLASDDPYTNIIKCACAYGADRKQVELYLSVQATVDYLITNRDRHLGNIGFLRNSETLEIVRPAPVFDSGSSRYYENERPEGVRVTSVNGCYKTELECLEHRPIQECVDLDKIPTDMNWFLKLPCNISKYRKEQLVNLFKSKLQFLKDGMPTAVKDPTRMTF